MAMYLGSNKVEIGVNNGGGGGGSSDFSAAEVVVTNNLQYDAVPLGVAHVTTYPTEATMPIFTAQPAETSNITVALYKNTTLCLILAESAPIQNVSVSGNAEFVPDAGGVIITGDCTITIS